MGIDNNGGFIRLPHHPPRQLTGHHRLHVKRSDGRLKRHARHTVPGILNGEHVMYRETRLHVAIG